MEGMANLLLNRQIHTINDPDLKNALMEQEYTSELSCYLGFYAIDSNVQFLVGPKSIDIPVLYKDERHTLSVYFWGNNYSYGFKNISTGAMGAQIVLAAAYLDNNQSVNYINSSSSTLASLAMAFMTTLQ